jgi:hypothetical protein
MFFASCCAIITDLMDLSVNFSNTAFTARARRERGPRDGRGMPAAEIALARGWQARRPARTGRGGRTLGRGSVAIMVLDLPGAAGACATGRSARGDMLCWRADHMRLAASRAVPCCCGGIGIGSGAARGPSTSRVSLRACPRHRQARGGAARAGRIACTRRRPYLSCLPPPAPGTAASLPPVSESRPARRPARAAALHRRHFGAPIGGPQSRPGAVPGATRSATSVKGTPGCVGARA